MTPLLDIRDLSVVFDTEDGPVVAVDRVSFSVNAGEALGVVGESGSGKSVTALAIMGLLPKPGGRIAQGEILFEGRDLRQATAREMRKLRGRSIAMIFQEPMTSLNPVFSVGDQIIEVVRHHEGLGFAAARTRAIDLLARVGIPSPARRIDDYPHQLSGGMRQRVMIAIALSCEPKLLIADEPTTALDVTIQAQLLDLMRDLQSEFGMGVIMITHNMGVIAEFADRVSVMYAARLAETGPVEAVFDAPAHPYTRGLMASTPDIAAEGTRLRTIRGALPGPSSMPPGCRFAPRCPLVTPSCHDGQPPSIAVGANHAAACLRAGEWAEQIA